MFFKQVNDLGSLNMRVIINQDFKELIFLRIKLNIFHKNLVVPHVVINPPIKIFKILSIQIRIFFQTKNNYFWQNLNVKLHSFIPFNRHRIQYGCNNFMQNNSTSLLNKFIFYQNIRLFVKEYLKYVNIIIKIPYNRVFLEQNWGKSC